jgi:hypothetical protein
MRRRRKADILHCEVAKIEMQVHMHMQSAGLHLRDESTNHELRSVAVKLWRGGTHIIQFSDHQESEGTFMLASLMSPFN